VKIRIEIETNEPSPNIASLASYVAEQAVKTHGSSNDGVLLETLDGDVRLDDISVDNTSLTVLEAAHARFEVSDVTKGRMRYAPEDSGPAYSLTFMLETAP